MLSPQIARHNRHFRSFQPSFESVVEKVTGFAKDFFCTDIPGREPVRTCRWPPMIQLLTTPLDEIESISFWGLDGLSYSVR